MTSINCALGSLAFESIVGRLGFLRDFFVPSIYTGRPHYYQGIEALAFFLGYNYQITGWIVTHRVN